MFFEVLDKFEVSIWFEKQTSAVQVGTVNVLALDCEGMEA